MAAAKKKEAAEKFPCPSTNAAEYNELDSIHRVQKWADLSFLAARELKQANPVLFNKMLDMANIEIAAEPLAYEYAKVEADMKKNEDAAAGR